MAFEIDYLNKLSETYTNVQEILDAHKANFSYLTKAGSKYGGALHGDTEDTLKGIILNIETETERVSFTLGLDGTVKGILTSNLHLSSEYVTELSCVRSVKYNAMISLMKRMNNALASVALDSKVYVETTALIAENRADFHEYKPMFEFPIKSKGVSAEKVYCTLITAHEKLKEEFKLFSSSDEIRLSTEQINIEESKQEQ